jgi:hypothetical protein
MFYLCSELHDKMIVAQGVKVLSKQEKVKMMCNNKSKNFFIAHLYKQNNIKGRLDHYDDA